MDRLDSMSVFVAIVDAGSLSAAARVLHAPLPTVSRKLSELERHLKTQLLKRSTRKLTLTDAGNEYLRACKRILNDVTEAERTASGEYRSPKGDLAITAPIVFGRLHVLPTVIEFMKTYPEVDVQLMLSDRTMHLLEQHIDIAVRIGNLPDSRLVAIGLGRVRRVVCVSPSYVAQRGAPIHLDDLSTHVCIERDMSAAPWTFRSRDSDLSVQVRPRLIVNTAEAAIDAAIAGLGVTQVLSYQVDSAVKARALQIVLQKFEPTGWAVNLVHAGQRVLPLKVRAFIDFATPRLRARIAALA